MHLHLTRTDKPHHAPSRMNGLLMSIMGPAQIGPYDEPRLAVADERCTRCGAVRSQHQVVREEHLTWSCCPPDLDAVT